MICNICTLSFNTSSNECPQCNLFVVERILRSTDSIEIDRNIKIFYLSVYKYFINKYNVETSNINNKIKTFMITKKSLLHSLGNYMKSNPEEIIIYMAGLEDGLRKSISSEVADKIFVNLIELHRIFVDDHDIFKLIHSIGPFIVDPWNCQYENPYLQEHYVKKHDYITLEGLFNQWNYQNVLHFFNQVEYAFCSLCNGSVTLGSMATRCITCNNSYHNQCFNSDDHICKESHHNQSMDSLIDHMLSM